MKVGIVGNGMIVPIAIEAQRYGVGMDQRENQLLRNIIYKINIQIIKCS